MLGTRLVRLIERHSEALSLGLAEKIRKSDRTSDFRKIPPKDLRLAATEVYQNIGEWLLQKTDSDISKRFTATAARRAAEGVRLHQFVWALILTRDHLWHFLREEVFADNIVELHAEMELHQLLSQFFDQAIYFAIRGYEEAERQGPKTDLRLAQELAVSIGPMSERSAIGKTFED